MQVAAQPDVSAVIRRLLTMREVELFLRNPAALNITAGELYGRSTRYDL